MALDMLLAGTTSMSRLFRFCATETGVLARFGRLTMMLELSVASSTTAPLGGAAPTGPGLASAAATMQHKESLTVPLARPWRRFRLTELQRKALMDSGKQVCLGWGWGWVGVGLVGVGVGLGLVMSDIIPASDTFLDNLSETLDEH